MGNPSGKVPLSTSRCRPFHGLLRGSASACIEEQYIRTFNYIGSSTISHILHPRNGNGMFRVCISRYTNPRSNKSNKIDQIIKILMTQNNQQ